MKTSLVCLLLLAVVVCAAPQAKQTAKARLLREAENARISEVGQEAGEVAVANAAAEAGNRAKSRFLNCYGPCFSSLGIGCWFDRCMTGYPAIKINEFCSCCTVNSIIECVF